MKLVIIFSIFFAASLAVPAPVPDEDDHDDDQFDDQQQFRRRLQRLSLSLYDDTDKQTRGPDRDYGRDRPGYADRRDRDDRPDHDDRRDHEVRIDRDDRLDRHHNIQRELIDRRDLDDRRIHDNVKGGDRKDRVQQHDLDDKPGHGLLQDRKDNDVLRKTHLDLLSNVLGRLPNNHQGHGNPVPVQQVRSPHPRVYDLGSLNFKYYAPAAPIYYGQSTESHGPYLRELNQDRDDDDDADDDDQLR